MDGDCRVNGIIEIKCTICFDTTNCKSIKLECGHAFGKSCMQQWLERNKQQSCRICLKKLTDSDIKQIKKIPLQERMVTISKRTLKFIRKISYTFAHPTPSFFISAAGGTVGVAGGVIADDVRSSGALAAAMVGGAINTFLATQLRGKTVDVATGVATGIASGVATYAVLGIPGVFCLAAVSVVGVAANYLVKNH
ncbi:MULTISPECIES: RING finger domain-containing protein [unclassified Endozoicomonas]|uniref:RING finger domain-containing protein n=1 Tax=unclassified Endozoicomonas TaxID=2644528 RepID=UPI003BB74F90